MEKCNTQTRAMHFCQMKNQIHKHIYAVSQINIDTLL